MLSALGCALERGLGLSRSGAEAECERGQKESDSRHVPAPGRFFCLIRAAPGKLDNEFSARSLVIRAAGGRGEAFEPGESFQRGWQRRVIGAAMATIGSDGSLLLGECLI